jgi:hypothetical protein
LNADERNPSYVSVEILLFIRVLKQTNILCGILLPEKNIGITCNLI